MADDIPEAVRIQVYARDAYRCRWCGVTNGRSYDCHHVRYRSEGGKHTLDNLITLCRDCHSRMHSSKIKFQPLLIELLVLPANTTGLALERQLEWKARREEPTRVIQRRF